MGCCKSTEKKPKAIVDNRARRSPVEADVPKVVADVIQQLVQSRLSKLRELSSGAYRYNRCNISDGVSIPVFENGICYRIMRNGLCYFYNDSMQYEVHVRCQFPPSASFTPSSDARVRRLDYDWREVSVVIYPLETVEFGSGEMDVCKTDASAQPLSKSYHSQLEILTKEAIRDIEMVEEYARDSSDEESTLRKCIEANTPYVDLNFLPSARMFSRPIIDGRIIVPTEIRRPHECGLDATAVDAIRGDIIPQCIERGLLGDSWLMCAIAILAENADFVKEIFAQTRAEEKALGAYRVAVNKNGWWKSVIVDDFLPTVNGVPCYARAMDDPLELWAALLQKAYAKLHGSYASITGGDALCALRDFSGAPTMRFDKEWSAAVRGHGAAQQGFIERLVRYAEEGHAIVLNTAANDKTGAYVAAGLHCGFTYCVEAARRFPDAGVTLLKLRNPWVPATRYSGPWSARCPNWDSYPDVREACAAMAARSEKDDDGSFWIEWAQAVQFFVGGGVIFSRYGEAVYDYRVQGDFRHECPSVVFAVRAAEPVDVVITLSQKDKRGVAIGEQDATLAPIMLSVSRGEGNKQRVDLNSSSDPENPSRDCTFIVGRDVAMRYSFEPRDEPYFVIPRIHRNGTADGHRKEFVLGLRSLTPLEGKLDIQFTKIADTNRVFTNNVSFVVEEAVEVTRVFQKKAPGAAAVTDTGSKLFEVNNAPPLASREQEEDTSIAMQEEATALVNEALKIEGVKELVEDKINREAENVSLEVNEYPVEGVVNEFSNGVSAEIKEVVNDHEASR